jgi:hypothetical protein
MHRATGASSARTRTEIGSSVSCATGARFKSRRLDHLSCLIGRSEATLPSGRSAKRRISAFCCSIVGLCSWLCRTWTSLEVGVELVVAMDETRLYGIPVEERLIDVMSNLDCWNRPLLLRFFPLLLSFTHSLNQLYVHPSRAIQDHLSYISSATTPDRQKHRMSATNSVSSASAGARLAPPIDQSTPSQVPASAPSSDRTPSSDLPVLQTAYNSFLLPAPASGAPAPSVLLRGVNLSSSSKFPPFAEPVKEASGTREERDQTRLDALGWRTDLPGESGWWDEAEAGGREGWFVGRPIREEDADVSEIHRSSCCSCTIPSPVNIRLMFRFISDDCELGVSPQSGGSYLGKAWSMLDRELP